MKCKNCGSGKMKHGGADEDYEYYMCQDCGKTLCVPVAKTVKLDALVSLPTQFVEMDYCCDCCKVEFKLKLDANNGDINIDPPYFCKNCKDMV